MKYAKRIWIVLNATCIMVMAIFFWFSKNFLIEAKNKHIIGVCYSDFSDEYQRVLNDSIYPAVSEKKDVLHYRDAGMDQSRQNSQIVDLVSEGCQLIIIVPVDEKVEEGIKYAKEKGVYTVLVDRMLREEKDADISVLFDNYSSGMDLAKYLTADRKAADILLICSQGNESVNESAKGFEDIIKNSGNKNFRISGKIYCGKTKTDLKKQLKKYKLESIDTVFCVSDTLACWAKDEFENAYFLSIGGSPEGKQMVSNKDIAATVNQFPSMTGNETIRGAYNILKGNNEENTIIVPSKIITINTVDSHDMEKWE